MNIDIMRQDIYSIAKNKNFYFPAKNELNILSDIAKEAYINYPLHNWFFNGKYDYVNSKNIMHYMLKSMYDSSIIYADEKIPNGFLMALLPSNSRNNNLDFFIKVGIKVLFRNGIETIKRLKQFDEWTSEIGEKFTNNKDIYLYNICVKKREQHHGIATKLLEPIIEYCNKTNNICYLDTNLQSNVIFYQHIGFKLLLKTKIPGSDVDHFCMGYNM